MNNLLKYFLGIFLLLVLAIAVIVVIAPYVLPENVQAVPIKMTSNSELFLGLDIRGHLSTRLADFSMTWQIDYQGDKLEGGGPVTTDVFGNFVTSSAIQAPLSNPLHYGTPLEIKVMVNESGKIIQQIYNTTY
jgi:hypothetical protein